MKAAQINEYGGKEVLKTLEGVAKPRPGSKQVLVEVHAAGVNPFDVKVRAGQARQFKELDFPATLGGDMAGIVVEIGEGVNGFSVGDEVYGQADALSGQGSFAEFAPVSASSIALKPTALDFTEAAAVPLAGVSAYQALVDHANLKKGQKILIHGGAGGIGSFAIQLAKHLGAYIATTAAKSDFEFVRHLGADQTIDYKSQDFTELVRDYDAVYDTVGGETTVKSYSVLKPGGTLVSMVSQADEGLAKKHKINFVAQFTQTTSERLVRVAELVDSGALKPQISQVFPLDEAASALARLSEGKQKGKVVIKVKN